MRVKIKMRKRRAPQVSPESSWNPPKYWVAMGTLAAYGAAGTAVAPLPAAPQESGRGAPTQQQSQRITQLRRLRIPADTLQNAIPALEHATGLRLQLAEARFASLPSPGVEGVFTNAQALEKLLAGTGLVYRFTGANTVAIELAPVRSSVEVNEQAPAVTVSSPKITEPLRDVPQTISIIPKAIIEQQGATSLTEVLRNVPGLTIAAGEGGVPAGDNLTLRGFSARNDIFVDGVRDLGPQSRDPFNLEQVEVIKGPQSAFTGRGSTGGSINLVSKQPSLQRFVSGSANFGNAGQRRLTGDLNVPLAHLGLGQRTAFRLNALSHHAGVPGRNVVENSRNALAPSLLFGAATPTRVTLNYYRLRQDNIPDYGIPWVTATQNVLAAFRDQPAPVPRDTFYGLASRDTEKTGSDMGTLRLEHDFSDSLQLRNQLRYGRSTRNSITSAPRFASNDTLVINRNAPSWITWDNIWDNQTDFRAGFQTGSLGHSAVAGATFTREKNHRTSRTVTGTPATTLYAPNPNDPFTGAYTISPIVGDGRANTQAFYAFDTAKIGSRLQLNGGLRWERVCITSVL